MTKIIFLHILIGKKRKCDEREEYLFVTCQREAAVCCERLSRKKREVRPGAGPLKGGHAGVRYAY